MKYAMTADGKIAAYTGLSQWITGESARQYVHRMRGRYAAILAGIKTVLADDPMLNCRAKGAHQPLRIIIDSSLKIPLTSQIVQTAKAYPTMVACAEKTEGNAVKNADTKAIDKLIKEFCDSPYINQENYAETLYELVEIFYEYKNETLDLITDDELIKFMKKSFDEIAQGDLEYLSGTVMYRMRENLLNGKSIDYIEEGEYYE